MNRRAPRPKHYKKLYESEKDLGMISAQYRIFSWEKPALDALAKPFTDRATKFFQETRAKERERRAESRRQTTAIGKDSTNNGE